MKTLFTHIILLILTLTLASCGRKNPQSEELITKPAEIIITDNEDRITVSTPKEVVALPNNEAVAIVVISQDQVSETIINSELLEPNEKPQLVIEVTVPEMLPVVIVSDNASTEVEEILEENTVVTSPLVEVIDLKELIESVDEAKNDKNKSKNLRKKILQRLHVLDMRLKNNEKESWIAEREILYGLLLKLDQV